jgi:Icc-related predicted phosphoesterase
VRAFVISDLHLRIGDLEDGLDIPTDVEIAIVAGDVHAPLTSSFDWLHQNLVARGVPTIFVAGNHEWYGTEMQENEEEALSVRDRYPGLHWLENQAVVLEGIRFVECTLWTDYDLNQQQAESMKVARLQMNDHRLIEYIRENGTRDAFAPEDALKLHQQSRSWLTSELSRPFSGKTVVVTHHSPHPRSIHSVYAGDKLNPAFCSDLSEMIDDFQPDFWVHGHTHSSFDYFLGKTHVICNPRGYTRRGFFGPEHENKEFDPLKTIDL